MWWLPLLFACRCRGMLICMRRPSSTCSITHFATSFELHPCWFVRLIACLDFCALCKFIEIVLKLYKLNAYTFLFVSCNLAPFSHCMSKRMNGISSSMWLQWHKTNLTISTKTLVQWNIHTRITILRNNKLVLGNHFSQYLFFKVSFLTDVRYPRIPFEDVWKNSETCLCYYLCTNWALRTE